MSLRHACDSFTLLVMETINLQSPAPASPLPFTRSWLTAGGYTVRVLSSLGELAWTTLEPTRV